jgi:hypothetical protein
VGDREFCESEADLLMESLNARGRGIAPSAAD